MDGNKKSSHNNLSLKVPFQGCYSQNLLQQSYTQSYPTGFVLKNFLQHFDSQNFPTGVVFTN
jgi:hypothetical protein